MLVKRESVICLTHLPRLFDLIITNGGESPTLQVDEPAVVVAACLKFLSRLKLPYNKPVGRGGA